VLIEPGCPDAITRGVLAVLAVPQPDVREPDLRDDSELSAASAVRRLMALYAGLTRG